MSGNVAPERLLLAREERYPIPLLDFRIPVHTCNGARASGGGRTGLWTRVEQAEQRRLTPLAIAGRAPRPFESPIDRGVRPGSRDTHRVQGGVEGATLHERLEHALVETLRVHARRKVEQVEERPAGDARVEHGFERSLAEPANRARRARSLKSEGAADRADVRGHERGPLPSGAPIHDREIEVARVHVRAESTITPQARASAIVRTTFSILSLSAVRSAAKNSVG